MLHNNLIFAPISNQESLEKDGTSENKATKDESSEDENKSEESIEVYQEIEHNDLSQEQNNVASQTDEPMYAETGSVDVDVESKETIEEESSVNQDQGKYHRKMSITLN